MKTVCVAGAAWSTAEWAESIRLSEELQVFGCSAE